MFQELAARQKRYEKAYDQEIIRRLPVIVRVNGVSFTRLCRELKKPYDPLLLESFVYAGLETVKEIPGAAFVYQQSDEITFVLKNDQTLESEAFYNNRVNKLSSVIAAKCTLYFNKNLDKNKIELNGDAVFDGRAFAVPSVQEAINNIVWRQLDCSTNAISKAALTLLDKIYGYDEAVEMLHKKTSEEKTGLLLSECGIDFHQEFPSSYRLGVGICKVPILIPNKNNGETILRNKWRINWDLPLFVKNKDYIFNIISNGHDVVRSENIITE